MRLSSPELGFEKAEAQIKPAGQPAEFREVAALTALRTTYPKRFAGLGGCWTSLLLQEGFVYRRRVDGSAFLSLGCFSMAVALWRVDEISETGHAHDRVLDAYRCLVNVTVMFLLCVVHSREAPQCWFALI